MLLIKDEKENEYMIASYLVAELISNLWVYTSSGSSHKWQNGDDFVGDKIYKQQASKTRGSGWYHCWLQV